MFTLPFARLPQSNPGTLSQLTSSSESIKHQFHFTLSAQADGVRELALLNDWMLELLSLSLDDRCDINRGERQMKKLLTVGTTLICLSAAQVAQAAYDFTGTIKQLYMGPSYSGKVFIEVASPPTGSVGCDTDATFDFVLDATTAEGKVSYSALLSAYLAGRTVRLVSSDTCTVHSTVPNLIVVALK